MEATEKQKGYIYALHRKLGLELPTARIEACTGEQASDWIDSLLGITQNKQITKEVADAPKAVEFNGARFGCVCKLIVQDMPIGDVLKNKDNFLRTAKELYELFGLAEQAMVLAPKGAAVAGGAR